MSEREKRITHVYVCEDTSEKSETGMNKRE